MEKCYKLHGYPPRYKSRLKSPIVIVNQVSNKTSSNKVDSTKPFKSISSEQYHQLMTMLSNHLVSTKNNDQPDNSSTSHMAGTCYSLPPKPNINSLKYWIVDSGASQHVCSNIHVFSSLKPISNCRVHLPNGTHIPIHFSGDIALNSD